MEGSDASSPVSSTTSFSHPPSPTASFHPPHHPPTLDRLITHFAAAKASLSSTAYVSRAASLVSDSRRLVEEVAILNARNAYLRRGVNEEIEVLRDIKAEVERQGDAASHDFRSVVDGLDVANERLQGTLEELRQTMIHESLRKKRKPVNKEEPLLDLGDQPSPTSEHESTSSSPDQNTLYSFIDPTTHETLLADLRADIDAFHASHDDFEHSSALFTTTLQTITTTLARATNDTDRRENRTLYDRDTDSSSIRTLFTDIEDHAAAMASLLTALVSHYDLCVSALKHTEGGGEAAKEISHPENAEEKIEESLYLRTVPLPIDEEERSEMFAVLERDAAELDDVVTELRERGEEQEGLFDDLLHLANRTRDSASVLRELLTMLHETRTLHLPSLTHASTTFAAEWSRIRSGMSARTASLLDLAASNEAFISAYDELLREVDRRERARAEMSAVAERARRELEVLRERDRVAREGFVEGFGGVLPSGIWEGVESGGGGVGGWEIREIV